MADSGAPPRTLVYHFVLSARSFGDVGADGNPYAGPGWGGRSGTLVAKIAQTSDGEAVVVDFAETVEREPRPLAGVHCTINNQAPQTTTCDSAGDVTTEDLALIEFLAPDFYDPARVDANGRWHTSTIAGAAGIDGDFTVTKTENSVITIAVDQKERGRGANANWREATSGTVRYDADAGAAVQIRLEAHQTSAEGQADEVRTFDLVSDSLAKRGSPNPH